MSSEKISINKNIVAYRVVVIDEDGNRKGEFLRDDAIELAQSSGLDLVLVSPGDKPVCKIMDYGKHLYDQKKKQKKGNSTQVKTKEIKFGYNSDDNYVNLKLEQARKFLESGNRVKITISFWGRQNAHLSIVHDKCSKFIEKLSEVSEVQSPPQRGGRAEISAILAPKPKR